MFYLIFQLDGIAFVRNPILRSLITPHYVFFSILSASLPLPPFLIFFRMNPNISFEKFHPCITSIFTTTL